MAPQIEHQYVVAQPHDPGRQPYCFVPGANTSDPVDKNQVRTGIISRQVPAAEFHVAAPGKELHIFGNQVEVGWYLFLWFSAGVGDSLGNQERHRAIEDHDNRYH